MHARSKVWPGLRLCEAPAHGPHWKCRLRPRRSRRDLRCIRIELPRPFGVGSGLVRLAKSEVRRGAVAIGRPELRAQLDRQREIADGLLVIAAHAMNAA